MNKIYLMILGLAFFFNSCSRKLDYDFSERPDAKIQVKIDEYKKLLQSSPDGWIGYLYPAGGGGFTFKFKFNPEERVEMYAMLNTNAANTPQSSIWSIKAPQIPTLYFDTYSYLHELADPTITKYGGTYSVGAGGDFEFAFIKASNDTIRLKGNFRGSDLLLIRAKESQGDDYIAKAYDFVQNKLGDIERFKYYYKKLIVGSKEYALTINTDKSTISLWHQTDSGINYFNTEYACDVSGIVLRKEFVDADLVIQSISDLVVDVPEGKATLKINGAIDAEILNVETPVIIDPKSPINLFTNYSKTYTFLDLNFEGNRKYLDLASEKNLVGSFYKQRYYIDNYDVFYYDYLNDKNESVRYISVIRGNIGTPNVIKYSVHNFNGTSPGGSLATKINTIRTWLSDSKGFYVYETGIGFYDLVSASDSKKWIRLY